MGKKIFKWSLVALAIFLLVKSPEIAAALAQRGANVLGDAANSATVFVDKVGR